MAAFTIQQASHVGAGERDRSAEPVDRLMMFHGTSLLVGKEKAVALWVGL